MKPLNLIHKLISGPPCKALKKDPIYSGQFNTWHWMALGFMVVFLLLVVFTYQDYGISWDEKIRSYSGSKISKYILSGYDDEFFPKFYSILRAYGGFFETPVFWVGELFFNDKYDARHFCGGLFGLFGVIGMWKLGLMLGGVRLGFISMVMLALWPSYYGHMFINSKDFPFLVGFIWSTYYILAALKAMPKVHIALIIKTAFAIAIAIGIRFNGIVLWGYIFVAIFLYALRYWMQTRVPNLAVDRSLRLGLLYALPTIILSYLIILPFWPDLGRAPLSHPLFIFSETKGRFHGYGVPMGEVLELFFRKTPGWYWLAAIIGLSGVSRIKKDFRIPVFLAFTLIFPVGYLWLNGVRQYDHIRHTLFVFPAIILLAGYGLNQAIGYVQKLYNRNIQLAATAVLVCLLLIHLVPMIRLHPYQYIYFNQITGGMAENTKKYGTDYWLTGYREACLKLIEILRNEMGDEFEKTKIVVAAQLAGATARHFYLKNMRYVQLDKPCDYALINTREPADHPGFLKALQNREIIAKVERMGIPIAYIAKCKQ